VIEVGSDRVGSLPRELAPRVLGSVVRRFHDFAACEDAVREALLTAATQWPRAGGSTARKMQQSLICACVYSGG
jgi:predicted RNA polymerase sigma factor